MSANQILLSEHFRPKVINELNLPAQDIAFLKSMATNKANLKNLLFYGGPGIGKTSAALILIKDMEMSAGTLSKADINNMRELKKFIEEYFSSFSLDGNLKILIINEVERFTKKEQDYLLQVIELTAKNGRFIFTSNDISKLIEPLKSRLIAIDFDVRQKDKQDIIKKMIARYDAALKDMDTHIPLQTIEKVVNVYFPDLRQVANQLDYEALASAS